MKLNFKLTYSLLVKILILVIAIQLSISYKSKSKSHSRLKHKTSHKSDFNYDTTINVENDKIIGETYTDKSDRDILATSFSYAQTPNGNETYDEFSNANVVSHLMDDGSAPPNKKGPLEAAEEVPTIHDYYDGGLNLNKIKVNCKIITGVVDCINISGCGWCSENGSCIFGTKFGPMEPCIQSQYIGGFRHPSMIPEVRTVQEPVGGVTKRIIADMY